MGRCLGSPLIGRGPKTWSLPVYFRVVTPNMGNPSSLPPQKIARNDSVLVCYAVLDESVGYTQGHGLFFVHGKEIGRVPCLAICKGTDSCHFTLYGSDRDWNFVGVATDYGSIRAARRRAEQIRPGSSRLWMATRSSEMI